MTNPASVPKSVSEIKSSPMKKDIESTVGDNSAPGHLSILWRIVFAQTAFCVQVSNNLGGSKPSWLTVSDKTEELIIPQEYLAALQGLGFSPNLITRYVVETRSIPKHFTSYTLAREYVMRELGLLNSQEWHPDITMPRKKGWFSLR